MDELRMYLLANVPQISIGIYIFLAVLLVLSAFFSSAETTFSSVNLIRLKSYVEEGRRGAKKALYVAENFEKTISTILVGNNLVNIAMASIAAYVFSQFFGNPSIANLVNTLVVTTIVLIFGEILPKSYAKENAEALSLIMGGVMYYLIKIMYPIVVIFIFIKKAFFKPSGEDMPSVTEDELETIFDTMEEEGVLEEDEADMLQSVLDLSENTVYDIMTPRVDMVAVEVDDTLGEILEIFFENQFSRVPIFEEDKDKIIGILHERNLFTKVIKGETVNLREIMTEPIYVSKSMKVDDLIEILQINQTHIAIVTDEFGGTADIVTMEDALEELVGEIYDEHDDLDQAEILKVNDNRYHISADMDLDDLFDYLNLGKTPESKYATVGGFVYELCEDIPEEGDRVDYTVAIIQPDLDIEELVKILHFRITKVKERRIRSVMLSIEDVTKEVEERMREQEEKKEKKEA